MATMVRMALWNLKCGISVDELRKEMIRIWPDVFAQSYADGLLRITVFKPKNNKQKAIISGFIGKKEEMTEIAVGQQILGRHICFASDNGDKRDEFGDFVNKRTRESIRQQFSLEGRSFRKICSIFKPNFLNDLNLSVFNPMTKKVFLTRDVPIDVITATGLVKFDGPSPTNPNFMMIRFQNALGLIQAMTTLNNNRFVIEPPPQFVNEDGTEKCKLMMMKGIGSPQFKDGTDECILDLIELAKHYGGYIPFEYLNPDILDNEKITNGFSSSCWRCAQINRHDLYNLVGVGIDLDFVAGICSCSYSELSGGGYKFPGEYFTRLVLGGESRFANQGEKIELRIKHCPMLANYDNVEDYKRIVLPIIEEEWFSGSKVFRVAFKTSGILRSAFLVEQTEVRIKKKKKLRDVYALDVTVRKNKQWCMENVIGIKKATVDMLVTVSKEKRPLNNQPIEIVTPHKARVRKMKNQGQELLLEMQVYCERGCVPVLGKQVEINPKPDKLEYVRLRRFLNQWSQGDLTSHPLLDFVLSPSTPRQWTLTDEDDDEIFLNNYVPCGMLKSLNVHQLAALKNARTSSLSFIQGPPGTGKTFTAGCIASTLAVTENGKVLICAPSNEATDRCAEMMEQLNTQFGLNLQIVRMMAKSRELLENDNLNGIKFLHQLVQQSPEWLSTPNAIAIYDKLKKIGLHKIKREEWLQYEAFVKKLEIDILSRYDVIICTVATLADSRAESLAKKLEISTLIIDEAGQLTQPASLISTIVNPTRLILIGDHFQLQATITSTEAKAAGLGKSELEWASGWVSDESATCHPPWTMLTEQHRMAPIIRKLVSKFSYFEKLEDAPSILSRPSALPSRIYEFFPEFRRSPILIKNVNSQEVKVGSTYKNPKEAEEIIKLLDGLVRCGVNPRHITVLSFYEAQRVEIIKRINNRGNPFIKDVEVKNVDAYQGRENKLIVLTMVRSSTDMGFLKIPNRLNVAISRAQELLIIVCKISTCANSNNAAIKSFYECLSEDGQFI